MELRTDTYANDSFRAMNTDIQTAVALTLNAKKMAAERMNEIRTWFLYVEQIFSRFDSNSELSRLNRSNGNPMLVSDTLLEVLSLALEHRRLTMGIYDPFILPVLEQAGYSESFDLLKDKHDIRTKNSEADAEKSGQELLLNVGLKSAQLLGGGRMDLGGIVKGWSVDRIANRFIQKGFPAGMINAGGDLYVWGGNDRSPWEIEIEDPWNETDLVATVRLKQGAAATSSILGRKWRTEQGIMHHLIDPRTKAPAQSDVVQCTVIGNSVAECEVYAKVICILGSKEGIGWFLKNNVSHHFQILLVTNNRKKMYVGTPENRQEQWDGLLPDEVVYP